MIDRQGRRQVSERAGLAYSAHGRDRGGGMTTNFEWDGQILGEGDLGLLVLTGPDAATPALAAAATDGEACVVQPDRLADFLKGHAGCRLICGDAAATHWALEGHLRRA